MATGLNEFDAETTDATVDVPRREFLRRAGTYAAVTPPLIATMLAVTSTPALANGSGSNGGRGRKPGKGNGKPGGAKRGGGPKCEYPWQKECSN
jgi:hypothetical protein